MTEILFVHGALVRDGGWWWRLVAEDVERSTGVRSRAVALPSCGETTAPAVSAGLAEDAAALQRALDETDGAALVVGHSYGGTVIAEGAEHEAARHLLLISSYLPETGTAQGEILSGEPDPVAVVPAADGTVALTLDEGAFDARFLQDVEAAETRTGARQRLTPQSGRAFTTPTTRAAWRTRPTTSLVCAEDRSTTPDLQRAHAARATEHVELPTGHHPFLSRPDLVADEVRRILATRG